ncbi:TrmH family RNA methyltransferase [Flagellimonas zhangzhouensis]|uniref:RNA methyltransferase, TrmH family n=1 Tax=Flagellimonas zhangzhouensis TaxID=1073328 RepID=A0A1H2XBT9_9FLAO|nr:RNA methyltransferase [Allomuricauda zhangzhouensis]SDQ30703.1 RNA methyltransferase, TrmH family [Allomuricauda zhangzhouensis]SDW90402.1 RNA methyltransferase, TrmH family [Allomuricauda zhangzhouensis]
MVTKNQIKLVVSLKQKKYRSQHGLFVVEGEKVVKELLHEGVQPYLILVDDPAKVNRFEGSELVDSKVLKQMSSLSQPNGVLGVFYIEKVSDSSKVDWVVVLDAVRDPGNLGTIIRLCDWFGIKQLICSQDTVDCYNPKVLQATMGSIARVQISYLDLVDYLKETEKPVYGAFMDGESVYSEEIPQSGILVMGNEANGVSDEVNQMVTKRISIPQFGETTTESLNVATATAILLNEIRRS